MCRVDLSDLLEILADGVEIATDIVEAIRKRKNKPNSKEDKPKEDKPKDKEQQGRIR